VESYQLVANDMLKLGTLYIFRGRIKMAESMFADECCRDELKFKIAQLDTSLIIINNMACILGKYIRL